MGIADGIRNIVVGCPRGDWQNDRVEGEPRRIGEFYAALLGWRIIRHDWIKVGTAPEEFPHLAFGDGWTDHALPVQGHVDLCVPAVAPAVERAVAAGGSIIAQNDDAHVVLADPFGHPVCVRDGDGTPAAIGRVVFDCAIGEAGAMAAFYEGLLGSLDGLGFREVGGFVPTTWPDPAVPEQIHLDLHFADRDAAVARAETLGARRLPRPRAGGGVATFADPAGHPLCLCTLTGN